MMKKQGIYSPAILKGGANTTPLLVLEKVIDSMSIDNLPSEVENTLREYIAELAPKVSSNVYSGPYIIELKTSDLNRGSSANSSIEIGKFRIIN